MKLRRALCAGPGRGLILAFGASLVAGCSGPPAPAAMDGLLASARPDADRAVTRIAFGSCYTPWRGDGGIWDAIRAVEPDLFLFLGDNVYAREESDDPALPGLRAAYRELAANDGFARLRSAVPVLPTWDDHDYGFNDSGAGFAARESSEALFEAVWGLSPADPRRTRPGVYFARTLGPPGRRLQLLVLDTRYFRSPLLPSPRRGEAGAERYVPDPAPGKTMLGAAQWDWLARRLAEPADLRLVVSSIQVLADGHGWEAWRQLPAERERLFALLAATGARNVLLLSGDRHIGAFYSRDDLAVPLVEATASSLNNPIPWPQRRGALNEAGPYRLVPPLGDPHFGLLAIDWQARRLRITLRGADGKVRRELPLAFPE